MARVMQASAMLAAAAALEWVQLPDAPWSARSDPCGGVINGTIVLAGGHANSNYTNDVWSSEDGGNSWLRVLEHAPWTPRSYHSCVVLPGERLLLVGGHADQVWFNDVWISGANLDLSHWDQLTADAPFQARSAGALQYQASSGKVFFMAGGSGLPVFAGGKGATLFDDVWASSDDGATWQLVTKNAGFQPREGFTGQSSGNDVVIAGQSLAIIGGEHGYAPWSFFGDAWTSEDGVGWVQRTKSAEWAGFTGGSAWNLKGRSGHIVASQHHHDGSQTLWLSGGYLGRSDVWCLGGVRNASDLSRPWTRIAKKSAWHGRFDHEMHVVGNQLVLYSGENSALGFGGPYFNDVWTAKLQDCPSATVLV